MSTDDGPPNDESTGLERCNVRDTQKTTTCSELIPSARRLDSIADFDWDYLRINSNYLRTA